MRYFATLFISLLGQAAVEAPNYNFSLDQLKPYYPGQELPKSGTKNFNLDGLGQVYRVDIKYVRYFFPVYFQINKENIITDMYAKLPSYFLHNIFHQSLINRYGKQDIYKPSENSAYYEWKNKDQINIRYSGSCILTCFPIYLSMTHIPKEDEAKVSSILDSL